MLPRKRRNIQPPLFHYGFPMSSHFLTSFAKEKGILRFKHSSCDGELCDAIHVVPKFINADLKIKSFKLYPAMICPKVNTDTENGTLLALCTNYEGATDFCNVDMEEVRALQAYLKASEPAKWYLCLMKGMWGVRSTHYFPDYYYYY